MKRRNQVITDRIVGGLSELARGLEKNEPLAEQFTCRKIVLDLRPIAYTPEQIKMTRRLLRTSQAVFAHFLGVKAGTVRSWEQGKQAPSDMAARWLDEIQRNPEYWQKRLRESIRVKESC